MAVASGDLAIQMNNGGQYYGTFTGGNIETAIYTGGPGRLTQYCVITAGTATATFYDGTQSTGGTIIHLTNQTHTAGTTMFVTEIPFTTGLVVKGTTGSAAVTVMYNKQNSNGT